MGNNKTAVRDPIFYRWHGFINDLFDAYHRTLRPYSKAEVQLIFSYDELITTSNFSVIPFL